MTTRIQWNISNAISALLVAVLVFLWFQLNTYDPHSAEAQNAASTAATEQLVNEEAVHAYLEKGWNSHSDPSVGPTIELPTGIFIQSLKFFNSSDVNLTGYIWLRYSDDLPEGIKPKDDEVGFVLPEQVDTDREPRRAFRNYDSEERAETIGWYFEATLRQPFTYTTYPFDHKTVWARLWPKDFNKNVVLIPDFSAYDATGIHDIFGIEEKIVLGAWNRRDTFFSYRTYAYDTNFGIPYIGQNAFPELHYNFVIHRRFENALVVHLLPIFVVAALLFGALLTFSNEPGLAGRHGFSTASVIAACSALFFVVLIAHVQLREQFAGSRIVYVEQFYFLMYMLLVLASAFAYVFATRGAGRLGFLHRSDGLAVKLAYWPILFGSMVLITLATVVQI
jgi:hypothetical protein